MIETKLERAFVETRQSKSFAFEWHLKRRWLIVALIVGLGLYVGLAWSSWQAYMPNSWLRLGAAWLLWLAPGLLLQQLLWRDISVSQRVIAGFGVTVALGGFLGLIATTLHLALWFVIGGFTAVTIVCALWLAARARWQWHYRWEFHFSFAALWVLAPLALAGLMAIYLTYGTALENDDLTYNAYVTHWLEAARFDWQQILLIDAIQAPSRFWLAYWPLNQALLAKWSALHSIELTRWYLGPSLALVALLATYALARAFDMPRRVSGFAVTMQMIALLLLTGRDQAGRIFFSRLGEDKVIVAFALLPLLAISVTAFLKQPTRGRCALLALVGAAFVLTHPTLMVFSVAATMLFVIFSTVPRRDWRGLGVVTFTLCLMLSAPLAMRFLDTNYIAKIPFTLELGRQYQLRRVIEFGDALYMLDPNLYFQLPFLWVCASALAGLFEWKTSYAARWLLAVTLTVFSVINPLSAWLWGLAVGSSQTWRALWLAPFGIAAAYLLLFLWRRVLSARWKNISSARATALLALATSVMLCAAFIPVWQIAPARRFHSSKRAIRDQDIEYINLLRFKPILDAQLTEPTVIVGGTRWLNERLPMLSANARVFAYRTPVAMWQQSSLDWADANARARAWRKLQAAKTATDERLAILEQYETRLLVAEPEIEWVRDLAAAAPDRVQYVGTYHTFELYRIQP